MKTTESRTTVEEDLKKAGQTETIKKAGTAQAKANMMELIELHGRGGSGATE